MTAAGTGSSGVVANVSNTVNGVITDPTLPQAHNPGDIVDVRLENSTSTAQAAGDVSFGQTFADGDLSSGQHLIAIVDGQQIPVQMDVKTTYPDGSVKFAVLTVAAPALPANTHVDVMLARGTPETPTTPVQISSILSHGYDATVDINIHGGSAVHLDAASILSSALQSGNFTTYQQGPLATQVQIDVPVSGSLHATLDITSYADGRVSTQLVMANDGSYQADANTDYTYDIAVNAGGTTVFQQSSLDQVAHTTWQQTFWTDGSSVVATPTVQPVFDMAYLEHTGAIPALDLSLGVSTSALAAEMASLDSANNGPEGSSLITQYMPTTGGRDDIGELTTWESLYLESQDPNAYALMLAEANAAGSVPWHFTDPATGLPVSIVDHPNVNVFGIADGFGVDGLDPNPTSTNGFTVDTAHQPELDYIAYLTTGNPYYLSELQQQANLDLLYTNPDYRNQSSGLFVDGHGQLRAQAWDLREVADAAQVSPDGSAMHTYFTTVLENNLQWQIDNYVHGSLNTMEGELAGWMPDYSNGGVEPPWEDDFMATAISQLSEQGYSQATTIADWMVNFEAGRFLNGANGFNPLNGAAYHLNLWSPGQGSDVFSPGVTVYNTWSEAFQASLTAGTISTTVDPSSFTISEYYPMYARGANASLFNATGAVDSLAAFGVLSGYMNANADLQTNPKWDFMPVLHDGITLDATNIHVISGSTGSTFSGSNADLLLFDTGTGNDVLTGGTGVNLLFAGTGNDTLKAGSNGDYLFGNLLNALGSDTLVGGAGNDVLFAGLNTATMVGGTGNETFVLHEGYGNDVITNFHAGDVISVEHYAEQSFAALQPLLTQVGTNVVADLDGSQTVTIQNETVSALTASDFSFAFTGPVYSS